MSRLSFSDMLHSFWNSQLDAHVYKCPVKAYAVSFFFRHAPATPSQPSDQLSDHFIGLKPADRIGGAGEPREIEVAAAVARQLFAGAVVEDRLSRSAHQQEIVAVEARVAARSLKVGQTRGVVPARVPLRHERR